MYPHAQTLLLSVTFGFHILVSLLVGPVLLIAPEIYSPGSTSGYAVRTLTGRSYRVAVCRLL